MSYLADKKPCKSCGDLYDADLLDDNNECRDCASYDEREHDDCCDGSGCRICDKGYYG